MRLPEDELRRRQLSGQIAVVGASLGLLMIAALLFRTVQYAVQASAHTGHCVFLGVLMGASIVMVVWLVTIAAED